MKTAAPAKARRKPAKARKSSGQPTAATTLYDRFKAFDGSADDLPADLAQQHDHYLYGAAKRRR